jgi:hypothetical protein
MTDPLRRAFDDLADEVVMVDLRDRALGTSRRRTRRRRSWVSISAIAAVLAVVGGAALVWTRPAGHPLPPAGSTSPTPSVTPSVTAPPTPLSVLPGTAIYLTTDRVSLEAVRIVAGQRQTTTIATANLDEVMTATISPDGSTIAFEPNCDLGQGGTSADLSVVSVAGGTPRKVVTGVRCDGGSQPIWFPDSASLRVVYLTNRTTGDDSCRRIDVATGAFTQLGTKLGTTQNAGWCDYVAFSPGGGFRARRVSNRWVVETSAGATVRSVAVFATGPVGSAIQGLSADGRYLAIGIHNTDPGIERTANTVVDTVTGERLPLATLLGREPAANATLGGISFLPDGGAVVDTYLQAAATHTWYLISAVGAVTAIVDNAPGWIDNGQFVYLP